MFDDAPVIVDKNDASKDQNDLMAALNQDSSGWDFPSATNTTNNNDKKDEKAQSFDDFFAAGPDLSSAQPSNLNADGL